LQHASRSALGLSIQISVSEYTYPSLACTHLSIFGLARRFKEEGGANLPYRGADEVAALLLERIDEGTRDTDAFVRFNGAVHAW
jgi:hypothetical protein